MLIVPGGSPPPDSETKILKPGEEPETEIVLHTSKRQAIRNTQYSSIGTCVLDVYRKMAKDCFGIERSAISSRYNCHGMTFASRRTNIDETDEVWKIITDDGYTEIPMESALPGDIVLYFGEGGDIDHSAVVAEAARYEHGGLKRHPLVFGKWGRYREVVHLANVGPYYSHANAKYYRCNHDQS
jgi:hypothetical protein